MEVSYKQLSLGSRATKWALRTTWDVLRGRWLAAWSGGISLVIGSLVCWGVLGWETMKAEMLTWAAYALAPEGAVVFLILLWSFWIAPAAVTATALPVTSQKISFEPFKIRSKISIGELGLVLAAIKAPDDAGAASRYVRAIIEDINDGKLLSALPDIRTGTMGKYVHTQPDRLSPLQKSAAIRWAEERGFNMDVIK